MIILIYLIHIKITFSYLIMSSPNKINENIMVDSLFTHFKDLLQDFQANQIIIDIINDLFIGFCDKESFLVEKNNVQDNVREKVNISNENEKTEINLDNMETFFLSVINDHQLETVVSSKCKDLYLQRLGKIL